MEVLPRAVAGLFSDEEGLPVDMATASYRSSVGHRSLDEAGSAEEAERMVRAGVPNMLPWVERDGHILYVNSARVADGIPPLNGSLVLHYPRGDLVVLNTMETCGCHHNRNDCEHRRSQTVTGR
jgi:hypothetical protein